MNKISTGLTLTLVTMAAFCGCTQGTAGGPGITANKPVYGQADNTFNLSVPVLSSSLQQGETMTATIGIKRGTNFEEDVILSFDDVPSGIAIEPNNPFIKHSDADVMIAFKAEDEAVIGDFKVKVTGHPTKGNDAQVEFLLTVAAKDSFHLKLPILPTYVKQGETQSVSINITRDETFDQAVAIKFGEMPIGVMLEPAAPVIKSGEHDLQVKVTAANDAALGNFVISVTGHPAMGADSTQEFKLTVVKQK